MRKNPQIFWTILLLSLLCIIWVFFVLKNDNGVGVINSFTQSNPSNAVLPLGEGQSVKDLTFGGKEYTHIQLGFSFKYPKEYTISSFGNYFDSNGETILLQNEDKSRGLQVLITPFDEDVALSLKRIKKDLPSLSVLEGVETEIGASEKKIAIVTFKSTNNLTIGKSLEAWFVYRNNLYQISSLEASMELFDELIKTWTFEE
jgi:hypothetical protein